MVVKEFGGKDIVIRIDHDKCTGCGECVKNCPADVYELVDEKSVAKRVEDCVECCICVSVCPVNAIEHSSC